MLTTTILITILSAASHPELGIATETTDAGVVITAVASGSPAAPYVKPGDRIVSINGETIDSEGALALVLSRTPYGQMFPVVIERDGVASTHPMMRPIPVRWALPRLQQRGYLDRPSNGLGLLIPGAIMTGIGVVTGSLLSIFFANDGEEAGPLWPLVVASGCLLAAGIPMTIVGGVRNHRYREWREEQQKVVRGGAPSLALSMRF